MRKYKGSTLILLLFDNEHSFNLLEEFSLFKSIIKFRVTERKVVLISFFLRQSLYRLNFHVKYKAHYLLISSKILHTLIKKVTYKCAEFK